MSPTSFGGSKNSEALRLKKNSANCQTDLGLKNSQTIKLLGSKTRKLPWTLGLLKGTAPLWSLGWPQKKCAGSSTCICKCCRGSYTIFVRAWIRKPSAGSWCQGKCKNSLGGSCANRVQASGSHHSRGTPKSANSFIFVFSPRLWGLLYHMCKKHWIISTGNTSSVCAILHLTCEILRDYAYQLQVTPWSWLLKLSQQVYP